MPGDPTRVDFHDLLVKTSRTFALAIPLLPEPPRQDVTLAYLLFRIADTFEDARHWPRRDRVGALRDFDALLEDPHSPRARGLARAWVARMPHDHAGYMELLAETPAVMTALAALAPQRRAAIVKHTLRTSQGMADFVNRGDEQGNLRLDDLPDLQHYCYIVAGIVGELLTELFLDAAPQLEGVAGLLNENARTFGEALQLVNILKDADDDAKDGRVYLPHGVPRSEIIALARRDLDQAGVYVSALQQGGAPRGIVAFCASPVLLARATLDAVETRGPGAKISRADVVAFMSQMNDALDANAPVL